MLLKEPDIERTAVHCRGTAHARHACFRALLMKSCCALALPRWFQWLLCSAALCFQGCW
jgi:hypothetical protein